VQDGAIPVRFDADGNVVEFGKPRETRIFNGRRYLMETALHGDVAILRAWKVDKAGNCVFRSVLLVLLRADAISNTDPGRYTTKSFAPLMAKAAKLAIVEAENIVEVGEIDPNDVDLPGIFVDRIVPATESSQVEILKTRSTGEVKESKAKGDAQIRRDRIARRAAKELKDGFYVNLGVGTNRPVANPRSLPS
jgi:3-oxoacid CoA-transferase